MDALTSMAELLDLESAQVTTASNGAEALETVAESAEPYDLIISDIGMPGMDGCTLLGELRKLEATALTPAIALSGFTRERDVERALAAGFETHVRKPVAFTSFLAMASRTTN